MSEQSKINKWKPLTTRSCVFISGSGDYMNNGKPV